MTDAVKLQRELKKYEFYSNMFNNHRNSLTFAKKRIEDVHKEIGRAADLFPAYGPNDFKFLIDVAELVYAARRAVAYTYVSRFYLRGSKRQIYFDFIVKDLEKSLEWLNKRNEEDWLTLYVESDLEGNKSLGQKFFVYKQEINGLRSACENFFVSIMKEISGGLQMVEQSDESEPEDVIDPNAPWTCPVCFEECPANTEKCVKFGGGVYFGCDTYRPKLQPTKKGKQKKEEA